MRRLLVLAMISLVCVADARTWTDVQGRTLTGEYVRQEGDGVVVRRDGGSEVTIRLSQLSADDQLFVGEQRKTAEVSTEERVSTPDESRFLPFRDRVKRIKFLGQTLPADYLGVASIVDRPLGKAPGVPRGLSLAKDGTIVVSIGNGTTPGMKLLRWSPTKGAEDIVPLLYRKYEPGDSRESRPDDEREGRLWFFAGQVAHDRDGAVLFTLGACGGNGIFRVKQEYPVNLQRLNSCISSSSLQVPPWDSGHAYIARGNSITRFKLSAGKAEVRDVALSVEGDEIYFGNTLLLGQGKLIAGVGFASGEKDARGVSVVDNFGLLIDIQARGYRLISDDYLGPMALAPDSSRRIRASKIDGGRAQQISEFDIRL